MTPTQEQYLTVAEAVEYSGVSRETLFRWMRNGLLTRHKRGANRTVVDKAELDEILRPKPADPPTG